MTKNGKLGTIFWYKPIKSQVPLRAYGPRGRIGNRVKIPDGTAAVSVFRPLHRRKPVIGET